MRPTANFLTALTMFSALPAALAAQDDGSSLVSADKDTLRAEIQSRYDAALAVTSGGDLVSADDPRFMWASEAKVQCGIALGFLKSGTRDETSIGKCTDASDRMARRRVVAPRPVAPVAPPPEICTNVQPGLLFFDFDSDTPKADAAQAVQYVAANAGRQDGQHVKRRICAECRGSRFNRDLLAQQYGTRKRRHGRNL
jgi:OmpA-OmpF porin, OOP family